MKIIILEGIATSGKTSVKNKLVEILYKSGASFTVIEENETLMPILDNADKQISINFLNTIIEKALTSGNDYVIFDRLYFTHIFKTNSSVNNFLEIEKTLRDHALLVFLKIDESKISERISNARKHREKSWDEYVSQKGNSEEVCQYYINQQKALLHLLDETLLKYKVYNSTSLDFNSIAINILKQLEIH